MNGLVRRLAIFGAAAVAAGCGAVEPTNLPAPPTPTCILVKEPLVYKTVLGLFHVPWQTRLERGPYISEKEDAKGTYYRGPSGAYHISNPGLTFIRDGGFYIPNDPNAVPKLYDYDSGADAPVQVPPLNADCSNVGSIKAPHIAPVYGHGSAPGGIVGNVMGAAIANATIGEIRWGLDIDDPAFIAALRGLAAQKVPVKLVETSPTK
jgi:hypothetical protein